MPLSRSRDYLSIGEVLEAIRSEFPDVSISKIRFLENEGLIRPERTESGYRKFYDDDVARLRYILALQRDQFLPLRVIKQRLAVDPPGSAGQVSVRMPKSTDAVESEEEASEDVVLARDDLLKDAGLTEQQLVQLEDFGIVSRSPDGRYGATDRDVARAAAAFFAFGVGPRHLRMFRQAADREVALIEQIVAPLRRRQSANGRRELTATVGKLADLSRRMREALLRSSLD